MNVRRKSRGAAYKARSQNTDRRWYLLSGLIRCSICGKSYTIRTDDKRSKSRYGCPSRKADKGSCGNRRTIAQADLEARTKHLIEVLAKNPVKLAQLVKEREDEWKRVHDYDYARITQLEEQLASVMKAVDNLAKAIEATDDAKQIAGFVQRQKERKVEAARIAGDVDDLKARVSGAEGDVEALLHLDRFVSGDGHIFTDDLDRDREIVRRVVTQIDVHPTGEIVVWFRTGLLEPVGGYWLDEKAKVGSITADRKELAERVEGRPEGIYMLTGLAPNEVFLADVPPPGGYRVEEDRRATEREEEERMRRADESSTSEGGVEETSPRGIGNWCKEPRFSILMWPAEIARDLRPCLGRTTFRACTLPAGGYVTSGGRFRCPSEPKGAESQWSPCGPQVFRLTDRRPQINTTF